MKRSSKTSVTTQYIVLFGVLLLLANILLGMILLRQTSNTVQNLIRKSMLNISNTAADIIDGDDFASLTVSDIGSEKYDRIYKQLSAFQNNVDIEFIYTVRQIREDRFVFVIDPDPVDPGQYGEELIITDALRSAGRGVAAVDNAPAEDRWGNFYSSYSPIFDSNGKPVGIVGVDFNASWYDEQVWKNSMFVIVISILFTLVGAAFFLLINSRVRRRFEDLNSEMIMLSKDVEELTEEIMSDSGYKESVAAAGDVLSESADEAAGDEIKSLGNKIHAMHEEMEQYLDYMHSQVNTDALTRVGNTTAYLERQKALDAKVLDGSASFSAVVFDINDLKHINDQYGHAGGDRIIRAAASAIAEGFDKDNTYRIGGDEFIAIAENMTPEKVAERLAVTEQAIAAFNGSNSEQDAVLSVSAGQAAFRSGQDHSFRDVFVRADAQMYERKDSYHRRNDNR